MKNILKYTVRIIKDPIELTECFALRFKVYSKTYPKTIQDLETPFESDSFDCRSIHIGLYCEDQSGNKLIGYCRFILPNTFVNHYQDYIIPHHNKYPLSNETSESDILHFEKDLPYDYKIMVNKCCNRLKREQAVYIETSRFIIDEEHRSISISSFFSSAMMAIPMQLNISYAFFCCSTHHAPYYKRAGLTPFPGIDNYNNPSFGPGFLFFGTDLKRFYKNSFNIVKAEKPHTNLDIILELKKAA